MNKFREWFIWLSLVLGLLVLIPVVADGGWKPYAIIGGILLGRCLMELPPVVERWRVRRAVNEISRNQGRQA